MKDKPPPDRRTFANEWDEIGYLHDKLLYWLYQRADPKKASLYAPRLERLLLTAAPDHVAILGEECWSLVHEAKSDLPKAIESRKNEIRLIRRLHELSCGSPYEATALKDYGCDDLSDRLDLLAVLYHDNGDLDKAIKILQESKKLCQEYGSEFDGGDMLQDYIEEKRNSQQAAAS
jgi:tetratricopeptide (TPR) repeat protein